MDMPPGIVIPPGIGEAAGIGIAVCAATGADEAAIAKAATANSLLQYLVTTDTNEERPFSSGADRASAAS
ncbi:MAG: hypothetical protein NVSMB59_21150 [Vulcanimicrobiaceae bacterium]